MIAATAVDGSPPSETCPRKILATMNLLKKDFRAYLESRTHVMDKAASSSRCRESTTVAIPAKAKGI